MSVDGQDGEPMSVTTGLPQGSPISPVLFAIYIAEIQDAVERQVKDSRGISLVDDVTLQGLSGEFPRCSNFGRPQKLTPNTDRAATQYQQASLSHLTRKAAEAKTRSTRQWISSHVRASRRYCPPKGSGIRPDLRKDSKELASRYFQLLSGHAAIRSYLAEKMRSTPSSECWWKACGRDSLVEHR